MIDDTQRENKIRNNTWYAGIIAAIPIVIGYLPIGFAFGVIANKANISIANILGMSLLVYAGSSQLIAVGMIAAEGTPMGVVFTTFIVNLRHLLMSAALSPYLKNWRKSRLALFAFQLTDESFALHSARFSSGRIQVADAFTINVTAHFAWMMGSLLGAIAGHLVRDIKPWALDYTLPALFIALLVVQINSKVELLVALIAGLSSLILRSSGYLGWNIITAAVIAATIGLGIELWTKRSSS